MIYVKPKRFVVKPEPRCSHCAVLARACRLKDQEIRRLMNKRHHLIESRSKISRMLDAVREELKRMKR